MHHEASGISRPTAHLVGVLKGLRQASSLNFGFGGHQQHIGKADDRVVEGRVAGRPGAVVLQRTTIRLVIGVLLGRIRPAVARITNPVGTGVRLPVEVHDSPTAHRVIQTGIEITGIGRKGFGGFQWKIDLNRFARVVVRAIEQRKPGSIGAERVHQLEARLKEATAVARAAGARVVGVI